MECNDSLTDDEYEITENDDFPRTKEKDAKFIIKKPVKRAIGKSVLMKFNNRVHSERKLRQIKYKSKI